MILPPLPAGARPPYTSLAQQILVSRPATTVRGARHSRQASMTRAWNRSTTIFPSVETTSMLKEPLGPLLLSALPCDGDSAPSTPRHAIGISDNTNSASDFDGPLIENEFDQHPGTFIIYLPNDDRSPRPLAESFRTNDLACFQGNLGLGSLVSVYDSAEAASWIKDHWDSDLLTSIRHGGWGGPLPCMLSPQEPALAIFGSYENPTIVNMAQSLAEHSGFPVVIRPACDDPTSTLLSGDIDPHVDSNSNSRGHNDGGESEDQKSSEDGSSQGSGGGGWDGGPGDCHEQQLNDDGTPPGSAGGGGGGGGNDAGDGKHKPTRDGDPGGLAGGDGGGGGGAPALVDGQWEGPLHNTCVKLALKPSPDRTYAVAISYTFKEPQFTINRDTNMRIDLNALERPLFQPEVIAAVDFEIETRPRETQVDRSYASIGFVVHREDSIGRRKLGFDLPLKLYKHSNQRQNQRGFQGALGLSQGLLSAATFSYARINGTTVQKPELDAQHPDYPLEVRVGMGINIRPPGSKTPLPKISFVKRNQVLIWVSDPTSKARIRGVMALMSSYLDNMRTEEELSIYEKERVELGSLKTQVNKAETISLAIAQIQTQAAPRFSKWRGVPLFSMKLGQRSSACSLADIRPHEYLARGWDANNNEWRQVLWPALDKDFRAADFEGKSPVWRIHCPWKDSTTNGAYTST
ncbi:hypothetical protein C8R45DRAFT_1175917 [Mycena sanguinolenta]|nr:hypothetical protein C8R45DRAFT_1175917 [Mycena sanguinolenta]